MNLGPRISVIGTSGSGKTWTASRLAQRLGVPFLELDSVRHGPNWSETPDDEFLRIAKEFAAGDAWVIDGNYTEVVRDAIWKRATGVVWLDYPRRQIMRQVIPRSFKRAFLRQELWNGNRERLRDWVKEYHPIRWSWERHGEKRARDGAQLKANPHLAVLRLASPRETREWLGSAQR